MGGDVIYIASKNSIFAGPNNIAYSATKADQAHQVRLLAVELGEHGIKVNGINPDGVVRGSGIFAAGLGRQPRQDVRHRRRRPRQVLRAAHHPQARGAARERRERGVGAHRDRTCRTRPVCTSRSMRASPQHSCDEGRFWRDGRGGRPRRDERAGHARARRAHDELRLRRGGAVPERGQWMHDRRAALETCTTLYGGVLDGLATAVRDEPELASIGVDSWAVRLRAAARRPDASGRAVSTTATSATAAAVERRARRRSAPTSSTRRNGLQHLPFNTLFQLAAESHRRTLSSPTPAAHPRPARLLADRPRRSPSARTRRPPVCSAWPTGEWDDALIERLRAAARAVPRRWSTPAP